MCGIAGYISAASVFDDDIIKNMTATVRHRGPDSAGVYVDRDSGLALGHRRLSIVDLSPAGHQPMVSPSGRYVVVFNGEIYNHNVIRYSLNERGHASWRGHSDTETLLTGFDAWGIEETLKKCIGMFALAVWDKVKRILTLSRDRMGEKPLYYGFQGGGGRRVFLFGSELKVLKAHPSFENAINRNSICLLLRHNCIPAPHTIYNSVYKLLPGHILEIPISDIRAGAGEACFTGRPYWSLSEVISDALLNPLVKTADEVVDELEALLGDVVSQQMISDVPLGAFLSGGIDSSLITAIMQSKSNIPVKTFSIGFGDQAYNESHYARAVADYVGVEHTEFVVTSRDALSVIPRLSALYDEPFSDSSQIPTFLVSQLARERVSVSLSGDGGDELFGGYNRYTGTQKWWRAISSVPAPLRQFVALMLSFPKSSTWDYIESAVGRFSGNRYSLPNLGNKVQKIAPLIGASSVLQLYEQVVSHWLDPVSVVLNSEDPHVGYSNPVALLDNPVEMMMALDQMGYLPNDILVKVDRAAMAVGLETRIPFLDQRIVEFAWRIPFGMKIRDGEGKWILRKLLERYLPKEMIDRPKMGFAVPLGDWLRGPLRPWVEDLLDPAQIRAEGYFDAIEVSRKWSEHVSGERNWQYLLWDVLMFQSWFRDR